MVNFQPYMADSIDGIFFFPLDGDTTSFFNCKKALAVNDDGDGNGGSVCLKVSTDLTNKAHWTDVSNSPTPTNSLIQAGSTRSSPRLSLPLTADPSSRALCEIRRLIPGEGENLHHGKGDEQGC